MKKNADKNKKAQRAEGFFNWEITLKSGQVLRSDRGFPIFKNPDYPNVKEDMLIAAASKSENGVLEFVNAKIRVAINTKIEDEKAITEDDLFKG